MSSSRTRIWGLALGFVVLSAVGGAVWFNGGVVGAATGDARGCQGGAPEAPAERHALLQRAVVSIETSLAIKLERRSWLLIVPMAVLQAVFIVRHALNHWVA